jgi:hypothetical protein
MTQRIFHSAIALLVLFCSVAVAQQFGPWGLPVNLGPVVNSPYNDQHPALSKDGLSLIFASDRPEGFGVPGAQNGFDLWVSQRDSLDSDWQAPQNLTMLNTPYRDFAPYLTTDGHWLFFHSNRPGGCGGQDLYATHRQNKRDDFGWEPPINLGCTLNSPNDDAGPTFFEDDATGILYLYFTRNDKPNNPNSDAFDIYVGTCTSDLDSCNRQQLWSPGSLVAELDSSVRDTRTAIRRRDGLEMILASNRCNSPIPANDFNLCGTGSVGSGDLWVSTRASTQDAWSTPVNLDFDFTQNALVPNVNSAAFDGAPALSWDGQTLIFYSLRPGGHGGADLYMSTRNKLQQ